MPFADYENIISPDTFIRIRSSTMQYVFVHHTEAIDEWDFKAILGAHAHIWLSLSVLKIFNWIVQLIHYLRRFFSKKIDEN